MTVEISHVPPEDLVVAARKLDRNYDAIIRVGWSTPEPAVVDWRRFVAPALQQLWGRLGYTTQMALWINAETALRALAKRRAVETRN